MDNEKTLQILLRFALDSGAIARVKSGVSSIEKELDATREKAIQTQKALLDMKEGAQQAGKSFAKIFATGVGITGGIFALASKYVADAKVATDTTKEWMAQTERLASAQSRIGAVFAKEALPLLKQAADLAGKAATFAEQNPDIVKAALNVGLVTATIGALGMAVSKGIQLYADAKMIVVGAQQLMAGKLMAQAAQEQLAAAAASKMSGGQIAQNLRGQFGLGGAAAGGGTAASSAVLPIVTTVVSLLVGSYLGTKLGNMGGKAIYGNDWEEKGFVETMKDVWKTTRQITLLASPLHILAGEAEKLGIISNNTRVSIFELQKSILGLGDSSKHGVGAKVDSSGLSKARQTTDTEKQIVDAYVQMLEDEKRATEQYHADRNRLLAQYNRQSFEMSSQHARQVAQAERQYQQTIAGITSNYQQQSVASEQAYNAQRQQVIRDGGEAIRQIEQRHQENLRRLTEEHNERVTDLVSQRDALGLVKEMRDFNKRKSELDRETNQEIAARRRDLAIRLQDMAKAHAQERAQRLNDYKNQMIEAKTQYEEEKKQREEEYRAQSFAAFKAKAEALKQLDEQYKAEKQHRREAFIAQVKDLDSSMKNEQSRKREWYAAMLKDVEAFTKAYRESLPSADDVSSGGGGHKGRFPVRDQGGYAQRGVYALAQDGRREFVLSGATTKAAEAAIGGALSQSNIMRAMGGQGTITVYDHRRFDSRLTAEDRRAIQADTIQTLKGLVTNGV